MATVASDGAFISSSDTTASDLTGIAGCSIKWVGRIIMFGLYALLFLFTLVMVGFIEIRQANMAAFNSLIAVLEQRDASQKTDFLKLVDAVDQDRGRYQTLLKSFVCPDIAATQPNGNGPATGSPQSEATNPDLVKLCNKIKNDIQEHIYALGVTQDDLLTKMGTLGPYYLHYRDGITQQAPQIIPALRFLDSDYDWVTALSRSPFEIMEMLLLVCMGMLGGVISVTRSFIEKSLVNPSIPDLILKPAIGGAVALGIYVLFRATQLFIAGQSQTEGVASTSIFLVAGLGLASGVCASDAIGQIEALARRVLHRSQADDQKTKPGSPEDQQDEKPALDRPSAAPAAGDANPASLVTSAS
jgi:hypothetical protein